MKKKPYFLFCIICILFSNPSISQVNQNKSVKPFFGQAGIKKKLLSLIALPDAVNTSADTPAIKPFKSYFKRYANVVRPEKGKSTGLPVTEGDHNEEIITLARPSNASAFTPRLPENIWSNFLSIDFYENRIGWPPDPNGAVGSSQVIVATNNGIKVYEKPSVTDNPLVTPTGYSGTLAEGDFFISLRKFFSPVLPAKSSISDPHIRYDRLSKRWFIVAIEVNQTEENNLILLAVSTGDKVTAASDFIFYSFNSSLFPYDATAPYAPFLDFPRLGVDKNSIVIGGNQFGYDSLTNVGYVINKKMLLQGNLVVYPFELGVVNFITGDVGGMYTPQGVYNDDPASKKSFFAGITYFQDGLVLAGLRYNAKNQPFLESETIIPVEPFNNPRDNSHPGSMVPLQQNDTRLLAAAIYKNKNTGKSSLFTAHAIGVNQSGHFINGSDSDFVKQARTGSRWYQVGDVYSKPYLKQAGTLHDETEKSGRRAIQYFNPSVASNGQGHMVLGGTTDAYNQYLNAFVTGHYYGDGDGVLSTPVKATNTTAIYAPYLVKSDGSHLYVERWGDFSQTVVDPLDDQTIWSFQEYANVDDSYGVRVVQVKAPPPATPGAIGTLSNSKDTIITLTGTSVNNSGFFDPGKDENGPGYNRLSVKSTGNVMVSSLKFIDPLKISFKLNIQGKSAGQYFLIITNPDGQFTVVEYTIEAQTAAVQRPGSGIKNDVSDRIMQQYIVASDVYPNPTQGEFKLQLNAAKDFNGKVRLMTSAGKVISENSYNFIKGSQGNKSLSLANLSSGNYLAAIYNADNVLIAIHKIVKQ